MKQLAALALIPVTAIAIAIASAPDALEQAQEKFPQWNIESFNEVTLSIFRNAVKMTSAPPSGGLYFRRDILPEGTYRLTISGNGKMTLRLKPGSGAFTYQPAPDGKLGITIANADYIEALIYSDDASTYRLSSISIAPCPQCVTPEGLKKIITDEAALSSSMNDFERVGAILDWTARTVDHAVIPDKNSAKIFSSPPNEIYQTLWLTDDGGARCGGFAIFFQKVLSLFGYESYTIDMGYAESRLTHVTVVVYLDGGFYVFDPTLNASYTSNLDDILAGTAEIVGTPVQRTLIQSDPGEGCTKRKTFYVCPNRETVSLIIDQWRPRLVARGLDPDADWIPALMKNRVYSVGGDGPHKADLVELLEARGITVTGY